MLDQPDQFALGVVDLFLQVGNLVGGYDQRVSVSCHGNTLTRSPGFAQHACCAWLGIRGSMALVNSKGPDQGARWKRFPWSGPRAWRRCPPVLIVARHGASARPEVINMPKKRDVHAPSRGRRTKKGDLPAGEIPGQLSIDDVLA